MGQEKAKENDQFKSPETEDGKQDWDSPRDFFLSLGKY